ncbi:Transporter associated domain protein [compost metagenome]
MTLIDIAERIGIHIPESPAYETIGGYIYTTAGTIPAKGWRLSHDDFDLEVLSSNDRALKKIKLSARR